MTSHPLPPHDEDDDLDLHALYRSLPRTEPSPELDAAVKQVAARAAAADRRIQQRRTRLHPGWGIAATVVLATGLFFLTDIERHDANTLPEAPPVNAELAEPAQTLNRAPSAARPSIAANTVTSESRANAMAAKRAPAPAPAPAAAPRLESSPAPSYRAALPQATARAEMRAGPAADTTATDSAGQKANERLTPDDITKRIAQIKALLDAGRRDVARQMWRDLQQQDPKIKLPDDLAQQLQP